MRRRPLLALLVAAALGAAACGDDGEPESADRSTPSTTSSSTTSEVDAGAAAALEVWREYTVVSQEWLNPPNPTDPRIPEFIAASALEDFRAGIAAELAQDISTRPGPNGPIEHNPVVVRSGSDEVVIQDCFVDDSVAVNSTTGSTIDAGVVTRTVEATLVLERSSWRISTVEDVETTSGAAGCD